MTTLTAQYDSRPTSSTGHAIFLGILGAWFAASLAASAAGVVASTEGPGALAMPVAIASPIVVFLIAYATLPSVRAWALGLDTRVLVLVHTWRMVGAGFLMLYLFGVLPGIFAWPAGVGDAATAAWALLVGVGLYGGFRLSRGHLLAWNTFGFVDFLIAVTVGTLSRNGLLDRIGGGVTALPMGEFPLALIPTFVVPLLAISHLIVYLQVKNGTERGTVGRDGQFSTGG